MRHFLCLTLLFFAGSAFAAPLTWTVDGTFDTFLRAGQGPAGAASGSVAGTFDYDADTNTYSNIAITTTNYTDIIRGADFGGTYAALFAFGSTDASALYVATRSNISGDFLVLQIVFENDLTNAGGVVNLKTSSPRYESLEANGDLARALAPGATVTAVPIPGAIYLFGAALGLLGWFRRRTTA